jgi:predicted glycoside hydrolase/deacetylase ChbG (UPF0249 family)
VVVVADDAGLAASSDDAIVRCVRAGIVRNVSLVANGDTAAELAGRAMVLGAYCERAAIVAVFVTAGEFAV